MLRSSASSSLHRLPFRLLFPLVIAAILASCDGARESGGRYAGIELEPARAKPNFVLTSTDGRPFDFRRETDGHLTLLFFGYTHCPDICPVHLANIAAALERLDPRLQSRVRVVFVTTDPARDSLARIRQWLDNFDRDFVGLRGDVADVNRIETLFGVAPSFAAIGESSDSTYDVGHAAQILAFTPDDSLRVLYPFGVRQQDWAADLPKLARVDGQ